MLARYRELGSNLEASRQVRDEAEKAANKHWHRIYERCWCGYLAVPSKFYLTDNPKVMREQKEAERLYEMSQVL